LALDGDMQARVTEVASRLPTYAPETSPFVNWMPPKSKLQIRGTECAKLEIWKKLNFL